MSPTGRTMQSREQGFTLIELLAVLVVLAIVVGAAAAHLGGRHRGEVLQATAYELASRCRAARLAAIRHASDQMVIIDVANRLVTVGKNGPPLRIPEAVGVFSRTSAAEQRSQGVVGIRFLPNGGSTGGEIRLEAGRQAYVVRVNWLTGRVVVEPTR
jgi:general secretion pathway protein H